MTVDEMLCRWAEEKYEIANVVHVEFRTSTGEDLGPDLPFVEVRIEHGSRSGTTQTSRQEAAYDGFLIREISAFALKDER